MGKNIPAFSLASGGGYDRQPCNLADFCIGQVKIPFPLPIRQLTRPTTHHVAAGRPALALDAVADVGSLRRVDHPDDLQLDARRQHLEQPTATAEEHRDLMDL